MIETFKEELNLFKVVSEEVGKKFLGELSPFTIRLSDLRKAYGSASIDPCFNNGETDFLDVCINPRFLFENNNWERNITTIIHELIHVYCRKNNIKEVSNNFRYHNKKFENLAKQCGLLIEPHKTIGVSTPGLTDEMKKWIDENSSIQDAIKVVKMKPVFVATQQKEKPKQKQSFIPYVCPDCGAKVRAKRGMNLICGDCDCQFVEEKE